MDLKNLILNKSFTDFFVMFITNMIKKGFGFFREIILASVFGSSIIYANFLLLRTGADVFSHLTQGTALQASLLSKFSKTYSDFQEVSLSNVLILSKNISWSLFGLSQLIQLPIVFYIITVHDVNLWLFIGISVLLGLIVSLNFYSSIFLIVMQGKGLFKKHSFATTVDMFVSTAILYPLSIFFGVAGIAISRIVGLLAMIYKFFKSMFSEVDGHKVSFELKDINLPIMLLGNFANIIMLLSRFIAGLDQGNNITFFNYSIVILNVFLTAVIMNLNTIVLRRLSIQKDIKIIFYSVCISLILGVSLVFFIRAYGFFIIQFIFERGRFNSQDTMLTFLYAKDLSVSFVFIFLASALFQPFFSLEQNMIKKDSKIMSLILFFATVFLFVYFYCIESTARQNSIIMIYSLSIISMLLSVFSCYKYFKSK